MGSAEALLLLWLALWLITVQDTTQKEDYSISC